jgi:hypothetical protein
VTGDVVEVTTITAVVFVQVIVLEIDGGLKFGKVEFEPTVNVAAAELVHPLEGSTTNNE